MEKPIQKEEAQDKKDADLIKKYTEDKDKIQRSRSLQERQWLVDLAFLFGKQHFVINGKPVISGGEERILWELQNEDRKKKVKKTANYILPLYRSLLARMLLMKAHTSVDPTTNSDRDKSAARVASEALEDFWQMCNKHNPVLSQEYSGMMLILCKVFGYALATGKGYLYPYYNDRTVAKYYLADQLNEGAIGEAECCIFSQFDVFEDPLKKYKIIQRTMTVEEIKQQYDVDVPSEDISLSDIEQQLINMLEGKSEEKNNLEGACRVFERWQVPDKDNPEGKYSIFTSKKMILDTSIPLEYKGRIPLYSLNYLDLLFSQYPQGMIEQLISLQEEYNFTLTQIHAYKKWLTGKLKIPKGAALEVKYDEEIGQIVYYDRNGGEPHWEVPPSPPTYLWTELDRIRRDMEDISAVHDATKFDQSQTRSGKAIENLDDLDNNALSPILIGIEQKLSFFAETVLDIIEAKYAEPRLLAITGDQEEADVKTFRGDQVIGNRRVKVNIGTGMPLNKTDRQAFIMMLADKGYVDKPKALELMEFGDLSGLYNSVDEQAQKMETSDMLNGIEREVNEWDNHNTHIYTLEKFIKGDKFNKLDPLIKNVILKHRSTHQQFMRAEMMAAANMKPGQPDQAPAGGQGEQGA